MNVGRFVVQVENWKYSSFFDPGLFFAHRASVLGENTFCIVCAAPNPERSPLAAPSNVLLPSKPNNVRLSPAHNCPSDIRAGFVLDWKIWPAKLCNSAQTEAD